MCGIWAFASIDKNITDHKTKAIIKTLFLLSETRGKEASGIAYCTKRNIRIYKAAVPSSLLIKDSGYQAYMDTCLKHSRKSDTAIAFMGHTRLATNGSESSGNNNQPVIAQHMATIHNGILVNVDELWKKYPNLNREHIVDTEIYVKLFEHHYHRLHNYYNALQAVYHEIEGMASTITMDGNGNSMIAASNNGSLYYCISKDKKSIVLASERLIITQLVRIQKLDAVFDTGCIQQLCKNRYFHMDITNWRFFEGCFEAEEGRLPDKELSQPAEETSEKCTIKVSNYPIHKQKALHKNGLSSVFQPQIINEKKLLKYDIDDTPIRKIRRCTKCILPETMPFIEFDEKGVCNYCRTYTPHTFLDKKEMLEKAQSMKKPDGAVDSLVSFSGGRDSSYGLHYFVKELGLHPVAYSYDWGMVTDLARRNQSRMCAALGVELVIVSADIKKKRDNIRRNVLAWLKKPDLGLVPLFMAGDKQFFYYANKVGKDFGVSDVLMATNPFERTHFKTGFCGTKPEVLKLGEEKHALERLPIGGVLSMTGHYIKNYIGNPSYINRSLVDTALAAISFYVIPHDYFRLFDYIPWEEEKINRTLLDEYHWEMAPDTDSTWRIGDGTAPFYNYIYYLVAGFTENDTLRSNQIREGMLDREKALELVYKENRPRFQSMQWYFDAINLPMENVLARVQQIPKLYDC